MPDFLNMLLTLLPTGAVGAGSSAITYLVARPRKKAEVKQILAQTNESEAHTFNLQINALTSVINEIQQERREDKSKIERLIKSIGILESETVKDKQKLTWMSESLNKLLADAALERASGFKLLEAERSENLRLRSKLDKVEARVAALEEALGEETRQKLALQSRVDSLENTNNGSSNGSGIITTIEKTTTTTETTKGDK